MRQTTELARVKARIKALAEKTISNGCTEAEAMAAAEMVGRLLERYALSMEEIDVREERCVQVEVPIGGKRRRPIDGCVTSIARFCDCKVWIARDGILPSYVFFGFDADTALASYLFNVIDRAMATALTAFRRTNPQLSGTRLRDASKSFQQGMAARIADRLDQMPARVTPISHNAQPEPRSCWSSTSSSRTPSDRPEIRLFACRRSEQTRALERRVLAWMAAGDRVNLNRPVGVPTGSRCRDRWPRPPTQQGYDWEERFVAPYDTTSISFAQAQGMVNAIWAEMGLRFPPKIECLPCQPCATLADADRLSIQLAEACPSWLLLHELAHAMTSTQDGRSDGHGRKFIGLYAHLLTRYLRIPADALHKSLIDAGIGIDMQARPLFVDD